MGEDADAAVEVDRVEERRVARRRAVRWNATREAVFFGALEATANVAYSARVAGISKSSAHTRRQRDPAFALAWRRALEVGYAELEAQMLRHALHGCERTETVRGADGDIVQTRTVHAFPDGMAVRLLKLHADEVQRYRAMEAMRGDGDEMMVVRIRAELARVRARLANNGQEEEAPDDGDA